MPFSLYGDLPEPSSEKPAETKSSAVNTNALSGLYASLPAPGTTTATAATTTTIAPTATAESSTSIAPVTTVTPTSSPAQTTQTKPAGWSAYGHFRPVMRKPTIQAKPKLSRPNIPVGATIVSTTTVNKESAIEPTPPPIAKEKKPVASLPRQLNNIPYFSTTEDVNGFKASQPNKKKGKKGKKQDQPQPVVFDMNEDYDPHRPNDYEQYKEERKQLREEMKRQKQEQQQRSMSPYSSDDEARSRSPSPKRGRAFAPPANLYESSSPDRKRSPPLPPPPPPPPSPPRREPSPPTHIPPPKALLDVNESADDAYMRRVQMSKQRVTMQTHPSPMEEDDRDDRPMLGLGAAQDMAKKVMSKYGWQEGQGLGRGEDGIREALKVQPMGRGGGVIVNTSPAPAQSFVPAQAPRVVESPVVLLMNMVGPGEVDDVLQSETAEECAKYGQVERCLIFEVPHGQVPEDKAVRIFVKFTSVDAARAALEDLNGRFFGGRVVTAKYYDCTRFDKLDLAPGQGEDL